MYFRIAPRFETAAPGYLWLNRLLAVGIGERLPQGPRYRRVSGPGGWCPASVWSRPT